MLQHFFNRVVLFMAYVQDLDCAPVYVLTKFLIAHSAPFTRLSSHGQSNKNSSIGHSTQVEYSKEWIFTKPML